MAGRVFVGRERELETIHAAVGEAASGGFGVVLIAGEPGVGKTRLADMALQSGAQLGVPVARCIASDGEVAAPCLPWRQVLRSIPGAAELAHAAGLSSLFPELAPMLGAALHTWLTGCRATKLVNDRWEPSWNRCAVLRSISCCSS